MDMFVALKDPHVSISFLRVLHVELARRRKFVPEKVEDSSTAFPWEEESLPLNSSSHPEEPRVTHIHDLPDEVMLYLWSWLPLRNCLQAARGVYITLHPSILGLVVHRLEESAMFSLLCSVQTLAIPIQQVLVPP